MLTLRGNSWQPPVALPPALSWIRGQQEVGHGATQYLHWQVLCAFRRKVGLGEVRRLFGECHAELSRSSAAIAYVWKEDTAVSGTRFELGAQPIQRNSKRDWEAIWTLAKIGDLEKIPADVRVVSYRTIRAIAADYDKPESHQRASTVYYGPTGTGKSFRAWRDAGLQAYSKDPRSKFWCGYQGEDSVVMDEFRGGIDVAHILRWLDLYPVRVEIKGSSRPLVGTRWWITSNLHPREWWVDLDRPTYLAFRRRVRVFHCTSRDEDPVEDFDPE